MPTKDKRHYFVAGLVVLAALAHVGNVYQWYSPQMTPTVNVGIALPVIEAKTQFNKSNPEMLVLRRPSHKNTLAKAETLARSFFDESYLARNGTSSVPFWCRHELNPRKIRSVVHGLQYVKVAKVASTTLAAVTHRVSVRTRENFTCAFRNNHVQGSIYRKRDKSASFLLGSVRDPAARAISRIFWSQVTQSGREPTDSKIMAWLMTDNPQFGCVSKGQGGFQLQYMALQKIEPWSAWEPRNHSDDQVINPQVVEQNVQEILQEYDFMVVVERMDESLVMLQLLLGVQPGDMLTMDSKVQGNYHYFHDKESCIQIVKSRVSPVVRQYLQSLSWYAQNYGDYLLLAAANRSLDMTIDQYGRTRFETALAGYRRLKKQATETCADQTAFHCTSDGVPQVEKAGKNCYVDDEGCGYTCIDRMLAKSAGPPA